MAERVRADDWTPAVWSHARLMEMQARLDPARMTRHADDWQAAVDEIRDVLTELSGDIDTQLDETWRGQGADAALASVQRYVSGSLDGLAACRSVAVQLAELSRAAGDLRACLSVPGAQDQALAAVRGLYSGPAVAAGNAVADIPAPPDPLPVGGPAAESVMPAGMPTSSPAPASTATTPSAAPLSDTPLNLATPQARDIAPMPTVDTQPVWRAPTSSATVTPPAAAPPALSDPPVAASTPPPSAMPPAAESPRTPGRASPSSAAMPFLGMGYPGLFGRGENQERRAPRYLIAAGNTTELVGELPLVAPPVIGE